MSVRRFLLWSASGIVVLALAIAAVLYWASRSETFLRWGIDRIATSLPCALRVEGLEGAFMKPVHIQHLICQNAEMRIEAHNVSLVWSPWMLTRRQLDVSSLDIGSLSFTSTSQGESSSAAPTDIGLPIAVEVASLKIGTLSLQTGDQPLQLTAIEASYQGDAQSHRLKLRNVTSEWGRASADATLGTAAPFSLTAALAADSARLEGWPLKANIGLEGELLRQLNASFEATTRDIAANGNIELLPLQEQPVKSITATAATIDAAMFDQRLPHTALTVNIEGKPLDGGLLAGHVKAANALAGKLDAQRLPVRHLEANFALDTTTLKLTDLRLDLGKAGSAAGTAELARDRATLSLQVRNFDLQAARSDLRQTSLNGAISLEHHDQRQLVTLDLKEKDMQLQGRAEISSQRVVIEHMRARAGGAQLQASATVQLDDALGFSLDGNLSRFDPARFGDFPQADINGNVQVSGRLRPQWFAQVRYKLAQSRLNGVALGGNGSFALTQTRLSAADAHIEYGGNNLKLNGSFGEPGDTLQFALQARHPERIQKDLTGQLNASGTVGGSIKRPSIRADVSGHGIAWSGLVVQEATANLNLAQADDPAINARIRLKGIQRGETGLDTLDADVNGTLARHALTLAVTSPELQLSGQFDGGWDQARRLWSGNINRLANQGEYAFEMKRAARLELAAEYFALGATRVTFRKTDVDIGETRFENGKLTAQGSVSGIRLSRLLQLMEKPPAVESTVVLGGRWEIRADKTVDGFIELSRTEGDIVIPGEEAVVLGLQEFRVNLRAVANRLSGEAILRSAQGDARVTAQTRLENRGGKWGIPGNAPLELVGNLQMQSIRPLATLASRAVTADGQLKLAVKAGGSFAEPKLSGSVEGDKLKLESVANGIFLRDGMIRATFGDNALTLTQFRFKAGEGEITANGRFLASGISPVMELQWSASKLAVIQHPELRLTVSGAGELAYRKKLYSLKGALTADQGRVVLRNRTFPTLGEDVVVVGREKPSQMGADTKRALLDLKLDLGPDFTIVGRGLDARLTGQVHLTSAPDKPLAANGEVSVASGTFAAYGRRLQIDKGNIYFAGPVNNPSLNIRAMRKNQQVEAGVEITGTARDPRIRLVSEPNVSDPNKLAWLVLGREAESGSAQDTNTMQSSAMAMAAGLGTSPLQQQLARAVGLDEITFIPGSTGSEGSVVAVGKQISDKIYLTQEFSTNAAANTFRVSYQLTRRWSLRSESGETDAVDLFFTFSFD